MGAGGYGGYGGPGYGGAPGMGAGGYGGYGGPGYGGMGGYHYCVRVARLRAAGLCRVSAGDGTPGIGAAMRSGHGQWHDER
jgi:hypothetical protein